MPRTNLICLFGALLVFVLAPFAAAAPSPAGSRPTFAASRISNLINNLHVPQRPWLALRDTVIQKIWRLPAQSSVVSSHRRESLVGSGPPPELVARYGDDVVLRFNVSTTDEAKSLTEASTVLFLDVWEFGENWVDIRIAKAVIPSLLGLLPPSLQHAHTLLMNDLAQVIYNSYPKPILPGHSLASSQDNRIFGPALKSKSAVTEQNVFFQDYQPLSVIIPWMRLLRSLFPSHVRIIDVGVSSEGRSIPALRVGVHPTNSQRQSDARKTIIVAGGSHAREWISTSTVNYVAYSLITAYGKDKVMTELLEKFDWIFIPTINPDGYAYTWEVDRLWRKNRQMTSLRFCPGIDLDRSWDFQWDGERFRGNPCSESFAGEAPFQAVESQRIAEWAKNETESNNVEFVAFLDLHSYSQQVLYPYSYSCDAVPPSLENLEELAIGLAKAIRLSKGERYDTLSACEGSVAMAGKKPGRIFPRMESAGGSALDWFYHELRVKYAYQIKLRDTGSYGFLLPRENIVPTGKEVFDAVRYLGDFLLGNKGIELEGDASQDSIKESLAPGSPSIDETSAALGNMAGSDAEDEGQEEMMDVDWELRRRRRR
ncbi:putative metallocarboxypeptidase ECM14 [Xylona heveae TC161]|uniref:Inactive metallocarboxypeptidase ECM14 n=1 Tax=Xylona heveae (strain CBS 132557 / TC161) TaxID=1328760 RepID=A0A165FXU5_XYLHT|nr:putative metallocarboxypeptidase ECM14 [Xylona heveae TC161]KZF21514.1 putative metallocarboxypeptidase ECM14 [Xylona heveae TC161]